jgi:lipoprotein-anchoring transpeptidase ErfK/SrfK
MVFCSGKLLAVYALSLCILWPVTTSAARQKSTSAETPDMASVNGVEWQEKARPTLPLLIKLQVLLDRAHVSPGEIDGKLGENTRKAIAAVRELNGLEPSDQLDEHLWHMLTEEDSGPALVTYKISEKDTAGPFVKRIPADFRKKAAMERLGYTSPEELLSEKFHMSQQLLRKLNRGVRFDKTGQEILVANVERSSLAGKISRIEVDAERQRVLAYDKDHNVVAIYPATVGSEDRPSPEGEFKITKITENPVYHYDPALHLRGVDVKEKLDLPPGPNNPVGVVWINLSAEGYGIHGTPDPDKISKAASHGCIRLTNWDALELAHHVSKGTPVLITRSAIISGRAAQLHPVATPQAELPPLPEQNPARAGRQARQTPPPPGEVPTPPWSEAEIAAAKAKCTEALSTLKLDYEPLPPIKEGLCGTPAPILLKSLGSETKVAITPPATLDCAMAGALNRWLDKTVQPRPRSYLVRQ